jgi:hypothetical protein
MTSWFDDIEDEQAEDEQDQGDAGSGDAGVFGSGFTLEELASRPGRFQELAAELLAARADREANADRDRLRAQGEAAIEAGAIDFDDPDFQNALRAMADEKRAKAETMWAKHREAELISQYGDLGRGTFEQERVAGQDSWFWEGSDSLHESPVWREHERRQMAVTREREAAQSLSTATILDDLAEAQAGIDAQIAAVLGRA